MGIAKLWHAVLVRSDRGRDTPISWLYNPASRREVAVLQCPRLRNERNGYKISCHVPEGRSRKGALAVAMHRM